MPSKLNDKCNWNCDIKDDEKSGKNGKKLTLQLSDVQPANIGTEKVHSWNFWILKTKTLSKSISKVLQTGKRQKKKIW